jgi:hypothetical protein
VGGGEVRWGRGRGTHTNIHTYTHTYPLAHRHTFECNYAQIQVLCDRHAPAELQGFGVLHSNAIISIFLYVHYYPNLTCVELSSPLRDFLKRLSGENEFSSPVWSTHSCVTTGIRDTTVRCYNRRLGRGQGYSVLIYVNLS